MNLSEAAPDGSMAARREVEERVISSRDRSYSPLDGLIQKKPHCKSCVCERCSVEEKEMEYEDGGEKNRLEVS